MERDDDLLAAEYVVGALTQEERIAVSQRIETDRTFARLVEEWTELLQPLAAEYEELAPPERLKAAIDERLFGAPDEAEDLVGSALSKLRFWRGLAISSLAAMILMVVGFYAYWPATEPTSRFVATLQHKDTDVHYVAVFNPREDRIGLSHVSGARPQDHEFVLWVQIGDGTPTRIGIIPEGGIVALMADSTAQAKFASGAGLMITTEPTAEGATPEPQGDIVALGNLNKM